MRFDYDGTGDSAGDDTDPGRVAAWRDSIGEAMHTLREATGCTRIGLVGVRLGATLAAGHDAACLVLWGAVTRGRSYLRELKALQLVGGGGEGETFEPGGFLITEETQRDIAALELQTPKTEHVLTIAAPPEMFSPPHAAVVPHDAIAEIVQWLVNLGDSRNAGVPRRLIPAASRAAAPILESIVQFDGIFGILTEPRTPTDAPAIVLPNAGATHHTGPNRLYVYLARALASAGFRCLRFDLPGLGDSVIDDPSQENDAYLPSATSVIAAVIAQMQSPAIVAGLCSGAHAAFHTALEIEDAPVVESVLINPLTFYYQRGMSLDQPLNRYGEWQWYMRSMRRRDRWVKLLRGQVRFRDITRVAWRRIRESLTPKSGQLARDLTRIAASGRKVTFVFSRFDPGYDLLMASAGRAVRQLGHRGLSLWRIDDADHTFEVKHSRDVMIDSLVKHLAARYLR